MKHSEIGYWVNVSLQHLRSFSLRSENIDEFETTMIAGEIALLLNAIRGREEVSQNEILRIAKAQKIPRQRCLNQLIPSIELIESQRIIVYRHKNTNEVTLEEHLFTIEQLNEVVGQIWEKLTPSLIERAALHILSSTFVMPRTKTEQINILSDNGFKDQDAEHSLGVSTSFSLVQSVSANKSQDPVIFNPYIWRSNKEKIAHAIVRLPEDERDAVRESLVQVSSFQGLPADNLSVNRGLLKTAHGVGLLDVVEVCTANSDRKEFVFSPHLTTHPEYGAFADDLLNDVRAVLACVSYGEHYSRISRLGGVDRDKTIKTLRKLINTGEAGDATAIGVDGFVA